MKKTHYGWIAVSTVILVLLCVFASKRHGKKMSLEGNQNLPSQVTVSESSKNFIFELPHPKYDWMIDKNSVRVIEGKSLSGTSYTLKASKPYDVTKVSPLQIGTDLQKRLASSSLVKLASGDGPFGISEIYAEVGNHNAAIDFSIQSQMEAVPNCKKEDAYDCLQEQKQFLNIFVSDELLLN